ncbi:NAD(P)-dependent oxidoreductase [Elioraea sp.]|uniref:NAD(P)-dependent oxidoreductase n=1 Tax=Elioraea sp. TaxID=2185103 RepID=UPI0025BD7187|nr:NAD(P)-dependent oxidoreductase [Elioraea sp.]
MHQPIRIIHAEPLPHAAWAEIIGAEPRLATTPVGMATLQGDVAHLFAGAVAFQVGSLRDELPRHLWPDSALLAVAPSLLAISTHGAGYDTVDVAAMTDAGVLVMNQQGGNAEGVAEHAVGMMLTLLKRITEAHAAMRAGTAADRPALMGRELAGRTVGLIGLGNIGRRVAEICRLAFGCRILAADPYLDAATIAAAGAEKVSLAALLAASDIVSVHCPLNAETRGMIGGAALAAMRPGAILVNTARQYIHDEAAVLAALEAGHLAAAGLDCWDREPQPDTTNPLLLHPRVLASPHTAGVTHESRRRIATWGAGQLIGLFLGGARPPRLVNPEAWDSFATRFAAAFGRAPGTPAQAA